MSVKVTNWVWHDPATAHLRGNAFTALLALADIADDEGHVIYAKGEKRSQGALAKKARMSVATFRRMAESLAGQGLLEVTRESQRTENAYRILMTAQSERSGVSGHTAQIERSERSLGERSSTVTPLIGRSDVDDVGDTALKRGTRIPDQFIVTADMWAWAAEKCPLVDSRRSTEMFVNHWRAKTGRDATKKDWPATWRNWLLRDQSDAERRQPRGQTFAQQKQNNMLDLVGRIQEEERHAQVGSREAAGVLSLGRGA